MHHWSKAGAPGQIPGYASHLDEVAKTSKFLQYGGHVGIGLGFSNSILKIYEACRAGETENCKKVRLKETGSFIGGMAGGGAGAKVGEMTGRIVCTIAAKTITKGAGSSICMIGIVGTGAFLGATSIGGAGEALGRCFMISPPTEFSSLSLGLRIIFTLGPIILCFTSIFMSGHLAVGKNFSMLTAALPKTIELDTAAKNFNLRF